MKSRDRPYSSLVVRTGNTSLLRSRHADRTNMADREKLYQSLIEGYGKAHPEVSKKVAQTKVTQVWAELKKRPADLSREVAERLKEWRQQELKKTSSLLSFWAKVRFKIACTKSFL